MTEEKNTTATEPKKYNKNMKQETFTSKRGTEYLFTYPGTFYVQKNVMDASMRNGVQDTTLLNEAIMQHILEGDYDWNYFDKKVATKDRSESIAVKDFDDTEVTYNFKFPGFQRIIKLQAEATADDGSLMTAEYYKGLMKHVITNEEVNFSYWDHHDGYAEVMQEADLFVGTIVNNSEYQEVMTAASNFVGKMFR